MKRHTHRRPHHQIGRLVRHKNGGGRKGLHGGRVTVKKAIIAEQCMRKRPVGQQRRGVEAGRSSWSSEHGQHRAQAKTISQLHTPQRSCHSSQSSSLPSTGDFSRGESGRDGPRPGPTDSKMTRNPMVRIPTIEWRQRPCCAVNSGDLHPRSGKHRFRRGRDWTT